ncbi:MAG: hypothetical protein IPM40_03910 [Gammaproteobacteria bacterium]|nr:hypothetical protein [Gammaproteobacteria bacterium]
MRPSAATLTAGTARGLHALTTLTTTANQTVTYTYDANGNMTGGGGRTPGWTTYNQLSRGVGSGITYTFQSGTDRQRYKKVRTSGTTQTTHYVGDVFERITDSGLTTYRHYVKVGGKAVAIVVDQTSGGRTKHLHRDHWVRSRRSRTARDQSWRS